MVDTDQEQHTEARGRQQPQRAFQREVQGQQEPGAQLHPHQLPQGKAGETEGDDDQPHDDQGEEG